MLGAIFSILVIASFFCGMITGRMELVCQAVIKGAGDAVNLSIALLGMMCLWSGVIRTLNAAGFTRKLAKLISPLLRILYPKSFQAKNGIDDVAADISANLLGLGNAALPIGMRAMKGLKLTGLPRPETANDDMITFAVLNTVPFQLMPTTLITMRTVAGSQNAFEIILPIWICSVFTILFGTMVCKGLAKLFH